MLNVSINLLSAIPVRKEPAHRSEMVSQLLFGEYAEIISEEKDFVQVKCLYDGYDGWVQLSQLTLVSSGEILSTNQFIGVSQDGVFVQGRGRNLPFGSPVYLGKDHTGLLSFGTVEVWYQTVRKNIWNSNEKKLSEETLNEIANIYLDSPYLWGGKSVYGIDCSGFAQQVFKLFGVRLLRDVYLQATEGVAVKTFADAMPGDLAFFHNDAGK